MKPEFTLTQLEEEPTTGFLGLTFTEVKGTFIKAFIVTILVAISIALIFQLSLIFAGIIGVAIGVLFFVISAKTKSSNRADKPLYYHRHLKTYKNPKHFIQPSKHYQRERTNATQK